MGRGLHLSNEKGSFVFVVVVVSFGGEVLSMTSRNVQRAFLACVEERCIL